MKSDGKTAEESANIVTRSLGRAITSVLPVNSKGVIPRKVDVAIIGSAAQFPHGQFGQAFSTQHSAPKRHRPLKRKFQRYMAGSIPTAINVSEIALEKAGVHPDDGAARWGVYAAQSGYLHPHLVDFLPAYMEQSPQDVNEAFSFAWQSSKVSPFLVTRLLNNNLLGLICLHWGIAGDCGAYVRDSFAAVCALQDAIYSLRQQYCDIALVVCAGAESDIYLKDVSANNHMAHIKKEPKYGAVTLVLERAVDTCARGGTSECCIDVLTSGYAESVILEKIEQQQKNGKSIDSLIHEISPCQKNQLLRDNIYSLSAIDHHVDLNLFGGERGCPGIMSAITAALNNLKHNSLVVTADAHHHMSVASLANMNSEYTR